MKIPIIIGVIVLLAIASGKKHRPHDKEPKEKKLQHKLPHCAVECIQGAMAKEGCGPADYACGCQNFERLKKEAAPCVMRKCGIHTAHRKVVPAVQDLCDNEELLQNQKEEEAELRGLQDFFTRKIKTVPVASKTMA